jgi:hypothetical protein
MKTLSTISGGGGGVCSLDSSGFFSSVGLSASFFSSSFFGSSAFFSSTLVSSVFFSSYSKQIRTRNYYIIKIKTKKKKKNIVIEENETKPLPLV